MRRIIIRALLSLGLLASTVCFPAYAQYSIDWFKVAGGSGTSTGEVYSVSGTIGQHDAGRLSGGTYTLQGGFWPGIIVPSTNETPTLFIQASGSNVIISWSPAAASYRLEQTDSMSAPLWMPVPGSNPTIISVTNQASFFRLRKQ